MSAPIKQEESWPFSYTKKFPAGTPGGEIGAFGGMAEAFSRISGVAVAVGLSRDDVVIKTATIANLKNLMFYLDPSLLDRKFRAQDPCLAYTKRFPEKGTMPAAAYEDFVRQWIENVAGRVGENLLVHRYGHDVAVMRVGNFGALERLAGAIKIQDAQAKFTPGAANPHAPPERDHL
ncbi:MAG: hypothetical protein DYH13_10340 [Alphaproteobacteria bacterium PRO2]|nr:hypothetical protein [Alphaproteobacteria bacterium PRO2]